MSFGVRNYLPLSRAVLCGMDAQVALSDPRAVRISMKAEANPTKSSEILQNASFLWPAWISVGDRAVQHLASMEPMWGVGCKSWKREDTHSLPGCL